MRILIDECLPRRLKRHLPEYECQTVQEMGWAGTKNGRLLTLAENTFDVLITIDRYLPVQQVLRERRIAVVVLKAKSNDIDDLIPLIPNLRSALERVQPTQVLRVEA